MSMTEDTEQFLELLLGGSEEPAHWRLLSDRGFGKAAQFSNKQLTDAVHKHFVKKQEEHYGVFMVVNEGGERDEEIRKLRACFIDADGVLMPESWPIEPSFFVMRDASHWHAYWLLDDGEPTDEFKETQQQLATYYKTDIAVCNLSRVMRVPGYYHNKGKPVYINLEEGDVGRRSTLAQLRHAHPVEKAPQVHKTIEENIVKGGRHTAFVSAAAHCRNAGMMEQEILAALKVMRDTRVEEPETVLDEHLEKISKFAGTKEGATCLSDLSLGSQAAAVLRKSHERQMVERADEIAHSNRYDPGVIPSELLKPGGMIGEMMDYIIDQSPMPQPIYALSAALTGMAVCMAGKVEATGGASPALLSLNLGPTGSGKDAPIKAIRRVFYSADYGDRVQMGNLASDTALTTYLDQVCPTAACIMDEAGEVFSKITNDKSGCLTGLVKEFMELFSSAGDPYCGKVYANADKNVFIDYTCFNLHGSSVPESVHDSMDGSSITSGFLPRVLIWRVDERAEDRDITRRPPPPALIEKVRGWLGPTPVSSERRQIQMTKGAHDHFRKYRKDCRHWEDIEEDPRLKNIWTRCPQKAERIALIAACSRAGVDAMINEDDILWAQALCTHITRQMIYDFFLSISDNKVEKNKKKLLQKICKAEREGITRTTLCRQSQGLMPSERDSYLRDLIESGLIMQYHKPSGGKRGKNPLCYWGAAYFPKEMLEIEEAEEAEKGEG